MNLITISKDGKITLPIDIAKKYKKISKFIVFEDGEKLILNPIKIADVSEIAKRIKNSKSMSLKEISGEVHQYRGEEKWKKAKK